MDRVRVGVAGVGHWASTAHMPAIAAHPDAELVAIADVDPARARSGHAAGSGSLRSLMTHS